jgi:hypothetical protein
MARITANKRKAAAELFTTETWEWINFYITILGILCSFSPMVGHLIYEKLGLDDETMYYDPILRDTVETNPLYLETSLATFVIVCPTMVDCLLDLVDEFWKWWPHRGHKSFHQMKKSVAHMSVTERLLFIFGMMCALIPISPQFRVEGHVELAYISFSSVNCQSCISPIMAFLCRCNRKVWSPDKAFIVILAVNAASAVQSVASFFPAHSPINTSLTTASWIFIAIATAVYVVVTGVNTCVVAFRIQRTRKLQGGSSDESKSATSMESDSDEFQKKINFDVNLSHTLNALALLVLNIFWFVTPNQTGDLLGTYNIVNILVACSVLVVEMRVRKNEISHGLSQLDSKRAFVRYASGQSTPLYTSTVVSFYPSTPLPHYPTIPLPLSSAC